MKKTSKLFISVLSLMLLHCDALTYFCHAQQDKFTPADLDFFENKIRPILAEHCLQCHGANEQKVRGGLRLTSRDEILRGGDSGEAVVLGEPQDSLLISAVHFDEFEMPPKGKLSDEQIADMEHWVKIGLPDPRTPNAPEKVDTAVGINSGKDFWAFRPTAQLRNNPRNQFPVTESDWPKSTVDQFIFAKLQENGLTPNQDADSVTLLRRIHFALTGLPPTAEEIREFVVQKDDLDSKLESLVDRLLKSHHFGERWGRHWLDVARFAESSGGGRSLMFPHAWRYRDYVIDAFNQDKPFNEFIREQIAGDLLPFHSHAQRAEQLVATGFLALGPTNYEQQDKELLTMEVIDEQVDTIGRAFMALTLGCARCHDHKFDPIPTRDYYAMVGIFKNTQSLVDGNVSSYVEQSLLTASEQAAMDDHRAQITELSKQLEQATRTLKSLEVPVLTKSKRIYDVAQLNGIVVDNSQAKLSGTWTDSVYLKPFVNDGYLHEDHQPKGKNTAVFAPSLTRGGYYEVRMSYSASGNRASNVPVTIHHQDGIAKRTVNQSQSPIVDDLFHSLGTFRFEANNVSTVTISNAGTDGVVIVDAIQFLFVGEDPNNADPPSSFKAPPETSLANNQSKPPTIATSSEYQKAKTIHKALNERLKILKQNAPSSPSVAMSVKDKRNPTNGHIHIRGSVRNLGEVVPRGFIQVACGDSAPPIPANASGRLQLADWIANGDHPLTSRVFVNRIWKHLFGSGLVETTDNFGKMGQRPSHPELLDFLARRFTDEGWSSKRLIREIMLSRTYRMSTGDNADSLSVDPENRLLWRANHRRVDAEVLRDSILSISGQLDLKRGGRTIRKIEQYDLNYTFQTSRRSVYVPAFRNSMLELFEAFDIANPNLVVGHRNTSTLPTQALFLMNSPWVIEQADSAASRLLDEVKNADHHTAAEADSFRIETAYLRTLGRFPTKQESKLCREYLKQLELPEQEAWSSLFHALYASLDFRYVN